MLGDERIPKKDSGMSRRSLFLELHTDNLETRMPRSLPLLAEANEERGVLFF
jgi:hypothetical protein